VLSLFPIIDVAKPWLFTAKVGGFIFGCQLVAVALFCFNRRKNKAGQQEAAVAAESISPLLN
jgi:hypothetical protein